MNIVIDNLEPCPRNRSHTIVVRGEFPQMIKTQAARLYEEALNQLLVPYAKQRDEFYKSFNPDKHGIFAKYFHGHPDLYTKTGKINLKSVDLDAHKVLKDVVSDFLGIDDGYIIKDQNMKFYYPSHTLIIEYHAVNKDLSHEIDHLGFRVH
jgi:hypothetical protein